MVLDEELVKKAKAAASQLGEAERQAQLARAEFHAQVRRVHLAGGSLREVAGALGLSHQRVQQIVEAAGGSWWQRVWRTRNARRDLICTFCQRPPSEIARLLAGPNVYICDGCVAQAEKALASPALTASGDRLAPVKEGARARCSFCGKRRSKDRRLAAGSAAAVCADCLRACAAILRERTP